MRVKPVILLFLLMLLLACNTALAPALAQDTGWEPEGSGAATTDETRDDDSSADTVEQAQEEIPEDDPGLVFMRGVLSTSPDLEPPEETYAALRDILSQPEFQEKYRSSSEEESWLEKLHKWLSDLFAPLGMGQANWYSIVAVLLIIGLAAYLVTRLVWEIARRRSVKAESDGVQPEQQLDHGGLIKKAREALEAGDVRTAIRLRFSAVIRSLKLPRSSLLTNYQVARMIRRDHKPAHAPFSELVVCFEDTWYGGYPAGTDDYDRADRLAKSVEDILSEEEAGAD